MKTKKPKNKNKIIEKRDKTTQLKGNEYRRREGVCGGEIIGRNNLLVVV